MTKSQNIEVADIYEGQAWNPIHCQSNNLFSNLLLWKEIKHSE